MSMRKARSHLLDLLLTLRNTGGARAGRFCREDGDDHGDADVPDGDRQEHD